MKNFADFAVAGLAFWAVGFGLMYRSTDTGQIFWFLNGYEDGHELFPSRRTFFFQMVFAATAATIVSGAIGAGRMKFPAYLIFSVVMTALIYPFLGHWQWGGGWLSADGLL